jgi:hypothetical protein
MMGDMPSPKTEAIKAIADAWNNPGVSPEYHAEWQAKLSASSEDGGWPVLYRGIMKCVAIDAEEKLGKNKR